MRGEERAVLLDGKVDVGQDLQAVLCGLLRRGCPWTSTGEKDVNQETNRRCLHPRRAQRLWQWEVGEGRC